MSNKRSLEDDISGAGPGSTPTSKRPKHYSVQQQIHYLGPRTLDQNIHTDARDQVHYSPRDSVGRLHHNGDETARAPLPATTTLVRLPQTAVPAPAPAPAPKPGKIQIAVKLANVPLGVVDGFDFWSSQQQREQHLQKLRSQDAEIRSLIQQSPTHSKQALDAHPLGFDNSHGAIHEAMMLRLGSRFTNKGLKVPMSSRRDFASDDLLMHHLQAEICLAIMKDGRPTSPESFKAIRNQALQMQTRFFEFPARAFQGRGAVYDSVFGFLNINNLSLPFQAKVQTSPGLSTRPATATQAVAAQQPIVVSEGLPSSETARLPSRQQPSSRLALYVAEPANGGGEFAGFQFDDASAEFALHDMGGDFANMTYEDYLRTQNSERPG